MPSVTSRGTRQSRASGKTKATGTFAPSSIMLSRKNLDSALEKTPPKPKSSKRIETWRREVSEYLPPPPEPGSSSSSADPAHMPPISASDLPTVPLEYKKLSIWRRIIAKFSASQKAKLQREREGREEEEEEGEYQRTGMWDEGSVRLGPGSASSLDYGSGSWESELGEIAGFDRFAARRDRLYRAQKLLELQQTSAVTAGGEKGKEKEPSGGERRIPERLPIINPSAIGT